MPRAKYTKAYITLADAQAIRDVLSMTTEGRPIDQGEEARQRYRRLQRLFGNICKSIPFQLSIEKGIK